MNDFQREIDHVEQRTRRYWFEDGLAEISCGVIFVVVGLYLFAEMATRSAGASHLLTALVNLAFPLLVVVLAFAARRIVPALKDRYVHPRTGYIAFKRQKGHRWATAALAAALSALFALVFARVQVAREWLPALEGGVLGVAFLWIGKKSQLLRFPVEGLLCVLIGVGLSMLRLEEDAGVALLFACVGLVFIVSGLVAFAGYLRHAPPPEQP